MIVTSALMIWKSMILATGSESPVSGQTCWWRLLGLSACCCVWQGGPPLAAYLFVCLQVVVVLSGSMEPGFYRGDILFLNQPKRPSQTGDISACSRRRSLLMPGKKCLHGRQSLLLTLLPTAPCAASLPCKPCRL